MWRTAPRSISALVRPEVPAPLLPPANGHQPLLSYRQTQVNEQLPIVQPGELVVNGPALELRLKGCVRPTKGLCCSLRGKEVEASKPVPDLGSFWAGGASGATGYRTKNKGVARCEVRLADPVGVVGTPTMAWVLGRYRANFLVRHFHALP